MAKVLSVKVVEARHVAAKDAAGTSDPYCVVAILENGQYESNVATTRSHNYYDKNKKHKHAFKTKTIMKTVNPVWQEAFTFEDIEGGENKELLIEMWDWNRLSNHDFLGQVRLQLNSLPLGEGIDHWYSLEKRADDDVISGQVHLLLSIREKTQTPQIMKKLVVKPPTTKRLVEAVNPDLLNDLSKVERKRQEVIFEIITTERSYVRDLEILAVLFVEGIRDHALLSKEQISSVFGNVSHLKEVHEELLKELEKLQQESDSGFVADGIGAIFQNRASLFRLYSPYCSSQIGVEQKVKKLKAEHPEFQAFLDGCYAAPECRNLDLAAFLIAPLQRMCKYPLLLKNLLETTPEDHADYDNVKQALNDISTIVDEVNSRARKEERMQRLLQIHDSLENKELHRDLVSLDRWVVWEGPLRMTMTASGKTESNKSIYLMLFNDRLVVTKTKAKGDQITYDIQTSLNLDKILYYIPTSKSKEKEATPTSVVISTASGSDTSIEEKEDLSYAEKRRHFKKTSSLSEVTTDSKLKDSIRRDTATEGKGERGLAKSQRTSITFDASTGPAWSDDMSLPSTRHSASLDGPVFATPTTITKDELAFHVINNDFEHPLAKALFKFKCSTLAERDQWMKSLDKARQNLCSNSSAADVDEDDLLKLLPSPTSNLHPSPRKFASFRKKSASRNGSIIQPRQRFSQNRQSTAFASTREVKTRSATLASDIFRDAGVPDERRNTADLSRSWEQELKERHRSASLLSSPSSAAFSSSLSAGISLPSVEELSHGSPAADLLDGKASYRESVNLQLLFQKSNSNDRFAASPLADRRSTEEEGRLYTSQLNSGQTSRRSLFRRNALSSKSKYKMEKQFREEIMQTCEDLQQKLMFLEEENAALKRRLLSAASVDASLEDEEEEEEESSWEIESAAVEGKRQERKEEGSEEDEKSEEDSTQSEKLGNEKRENSALKDENKRLRTVNARLRKQLITLQEEIENERRIFRSQSVQRVMDLLTYKKELERMAETEGESPLGASDEDSDTQPRNGEGGDTIKRHDKKREKKDKKKEKKAKTKKKEKKGKHATLDRIPEETKSDKWQALRKKLIEAEGADASASQKTKVVQRVAFYEGWAQNNSCENLRQFFDKFSADPNFLRTGKSNASANNNNPRTTKSASRQTTLK